MATEPADRERFWADTARSLARTWAADWKEEKDEFPIDAWKAMARAGLMGLGLPEEYGGRPGGRPALAAALAAFVQAGAPLGLALSWALSHLAAGFLIHGFGRPDQQRIWIPKLAAGMVGAVAMSEPGVGAHPGRMTTLARPVRDGYELTGEKTWLTNGPIAELFIVMAVTGQSETKNEITAFLAPASTPGLVRTGPIPMDFLKPSPHGGIRLDRAWAPAENRLGAIGNAYQAMIRPFRMMEDAVLLGPLAGALARLAWCCGREAPPGDLPDEPARALARVWAASKSAGLMAREAALRLDQGANPEAIEPFCWVGRDMAEAAAGLVNSFYAGLGMEPGYESVRLLKDVARTATLAGHAIHLGQAKRGRNLMVRFRTEEEQAESA